ncbi:MAG: amylo-alpha-1,6-glucosidase [Planctomycetota bacterium]
MPDAPAPSPRDPHRVALPGPEVPTPAALAGLIDREWLLTDGQGGFAMGSAAGANTRRYHGLLVAATQPPVGRVVLLSQTFDRLELRYPDPPKTHAEPDAEPETATEVVEWSTCLFQGASHNHGAVPLAAPQGWTRLARFEVGLDAVWTYHAQTRAGRLTLTRRLVRTPGRPACQLIYRVTGLDPDAGAVATLRIAPLLAMRDFHHLASEHDPTPIAADIDAAEAPARITARRGALACTLSAQHARFDPGPDWWRRVWYPVETRRGQDDHEDLYKPGAFVSDAEPGAAILELTLNASLGDSPEQEPNPDAALAERRSRIECHAQALGTDAGDPDPRTPALLARAADDFVAPRVMTFAGRKCKLSTVMAGYPWFADWGRDAFIALPGLLLATGRHDQAKAVLLAYAAAQRNGLLPNRFDDENPDHADYNTLDAPLWYLHSAIAYADAACDGAMPDWLADACLRTVDAFAQGVEIETHMGPPAYAYVGTDGLVCAGHRQSQLTWMDAAADGVVFTPRHGRAVEINALWGHGTSGLAERLSADRPNDAERCRAHADACRASFTQTFVRPDGLGLYDHLPNDGPPCPAIRSNQVFTLSLARSPLEADQKPHVLEIVRKHLLTQSGLRTLSPEDPDYHPRYAGPPFERDAAYHRGTIWPWLIGPYAEAVLRVGGFAPDSRQAARRAITPLLAGLSGPGAREVQEGQGAIAQVHEIHQAQTDALGRHPARGCPAQAWSVAELVRARAMLRHDRPTDSPI